MAPRPLSVRAQVLGIVLLAAVLPLGLIGLYLARSSVREGERLLDRHLAAALVSIERSAVAHWEHRAGALELLASNVPAQTLLRSGAMSRGDSLFLSQLAQDILATIPIVLYRDNAGREGWASVTDAVVDDSVSVSRPPMLPVTLPVMASDGQVGTLEAHVRLDRVIPMDSLGLFLPGALLAVRALADQRVLVPFGLRVEFPPGREFLARDEEWRAHFDTLSAPGLEIAVATRTDPYLTAFERSGRQGLLAVLAVATVAIVLTILLTARMARSVGSLANVAQAIAGGDLARRAEPSGAAELQRLAHSFNTMTDSLRRMVAELGQRRALAAVGEFATELSHEVRNALTSVQIDLERVEERSEDPKNRALVARTLSSVRRLDAAVTGSLRIARSGSVVARDVRLGDVLREAMRVAEPSFTAASARVVVRELDDSMVVPGDREALHQLFLNLLLNAQQAVAPGGEAVVSARIEGGHIFVSVADTGHGMTSEQVSRALDPYYTTRPGGTGLGLPIAKQIAAAHGGELTIRSAPGTGTTVEVALPVVRARSSADRVQV